MIHENKNKNKNTFHTKYKIKLFVDVIHCRITNSDSSFAKLLDVANDG